MGSSQDMVSKGFQRTQQRSVRQIENGQNPFHSCFLCACSQRNTINAYDIHTNIYICVCDIILIHIRGPNTYYVHACNIQTYDIHMCMSCDILVTYMLVCLCAYILICTHVTHILILFMSATCLLRYLLSDCVFYIVKKRTTLRLHSLRDWVTGGLPKTLLL